MLSTILVAVLGLVGAIFSTILSYRAASQANRAAAETARSAERQVEGEAYSRGQVMYEKLLTEADRHLDRLRSQIQLLSEELERVSKQLAAEQTANDLLRVQVRQLHERLQTMESHLGSPAGDATTGCD